jgi:hypothetical protein
MAKKCVYCGGLVGKGDRHAKGSCRVPPHGEKHHRRLRAQKRARRTVALPQRGVPVKLNKPIKNA